MKTRNLTIYVAPNLYAITVGIERGFETSDYRSELEDFVEVEAWW